MKILHTADWHLGKKLYQHSRLEEQKEVLAEIAKVADEHDVDAILIAGDLFDNFNPSAEVTELFYSALHKMSKHGARPIIAIAGNHDSPDRVAAPDPLASACGIFLIGYPNTLLRSNTSHPDWSISQTDEGFLELQFKDAPPLRIITTAFTNELRIKQYLGNEEAAGIRDYLAAHWQRLADKYMDDNGINLLMAHLLVWNQSDPAPAEPEGEKPILIGNASIVYSALIPSAVQYVALGHLHRAQLISGNTMPIQYSGSPLAYSFAEAGQQKYVQIVELAPGTTPCITHIPIQAGKKLSTATFKDIDTAAEWIQSHANDHLEIKLQLDRYINAAEIKQLQSSTEHLLNIIPIITTNKQAPLNTTETAQDDIQSLFIQYFTEKKGIPPNEDLIQIFKSLLQEDKLDSY